MISVRETVRLAPLPRPDGDTLSFDARRRKAHVSLPMPQPESGAAGPLTTDTGPVKVPVKRTRLSKPKVKTGCTTCKIRRIKCDEAKPNCNRCTSTGRSCDGYAVPGSKKASSLYIRSPSASVYVVAPWNRLLDHQGNQLEHRYLDFFRRQTAPVLSGYFDSYFWNCLILQIGHSEPTIQHAMMAIASIHEQVEIEECQVSCPGVRGHYGGGFALQQYNKAISQLKKRLSTGPQSEELTLLCCVLFICLEFLRGNNDAALSHLLSGLEIMAAWRTKNRKLLPDEALPVATEPVSVPDNLVQIFSRLSIQSMLCGRDLPVGKLLLAELDPVSMTPAVFPNLQAGRASLDFLMKLCMQYLRELSVPGFAVSEAAKARREDLTKGLERWSLAFDFWLIGTSGTRTAQETRAATNLRILNFVSRIWISSSVSAQESIFDKETRTFSAMVNLAESMNSDRSGMTAKPEFTGVAMKQGDVPHSFTFEMGIIPPLYFVATKCRVPSIRRAAVAVLNTTLPRREGLWIASLYVAISKRIIEIEEEDLPRLGYKEDITGELVPPEWKRVKVVQSHTSREGDLVERKQKVLFITKPNGPTGPGVQREEVIFW